MLEEKTNNPSHETHFLSPEERKVIDEQIYLETSKIAINMSTLGGTTNIISGLFVLWVMFNKASLGLLLGWYGLLVLANLVNIGAARYYRNKIADPRVHKIWRLVFSIIFGVICILWGIMPILFYTPEINFQVYTLSFLLAVIIGFSFPSITDFTLAVISLCCLLVPSIVFYLYQWIHNFNVPNQGTDISFGIGSSLLILGLFLITVCRFGSRWVKRFFQLSLTNVALTGKLENMNKLLEQRVKERTTELEKSLGQVTYQATHDLLTDLPNHRSLVQFMKKAVRFCRQHDEMLGVVFFSINEIDRIYNALGHQTGDIVIKTVASRFQEAYGEPNIDNIEVYNYVVTLSRKDVFVILLQHITSPEEVEAKIEPLLNILEKPIYTEKQVIKLTASVGASLYPRNGRDISSLIMNADAAMLLAKQPGGNCIKMYKAEINASITKQLEMESGLHTALLRTEFIIQYQPFIDLKTGLISGMEALVRWENPALGRIGPDNFIPLAEANGIIIPLGEWVLRSACAQTKQWHEEGHSPLKIAINLSAKQLHYKFIMQSIINILKEVKLDPHFIELELTETTVFQKDVIPIVRELREMGFLLSIDDFGTGYSGLTNLKQLTVDKIKIDKSFVQDVVTSSDSRAIVANIIGLAKKLNIVVVAEGVETKEQLEFLQMNDCDVAQGFYFSPAADPEVISELLQSKTRFMRDL
ncbi:MAG: EAL domain-containing protein [Gammaproteobacteria bacterium]|nr:EAL domain-containing protein [Gammaproteobacteria bacterium]